MEITIKIDDERIAQLVEEQIANEIVKDYGGIARNAKLGLRDGVDKAIKNYIYSQKDKIVERVVKRASTEIVRKGLPKLIENIAQGELEG